VNPVAPTLLQIVPALPGGGLARATIETAQATIAAGGRAIIASAGGAMVADLLRLRGTHIDLPATRHPLLARLSLPQRLAQAVNNLDVGLILARTPETAWIARALARRIRRPWISVLHAPPRRAGLLDRLLASRQVAADAVIAVSEFVARDARTHVPAVESRLSIVPPGINLDRFDPAVVRADRVIRLAAELRVPEDRRLVLCPGRFEHDSGQLLLVDAIKRIGRDDIFCLLLGASPAPTPFQRTLERAIDMAGLGGRVQIGPYIDDMPAAYMLADAVVATGGPAQGFSRTLVEAQAMGRPVVAEDGGGAAEAIRNGVSGWLSPAGDATALAGAIDAALSLPADRRAELARAAQDHARQRHGLAAHNAALLDLFRRVAAPTPA